MSAAAGKELNMAEKKDTARPLEFIRKNKKASIAIGSITLLVIAAIVVTIILLANSAKPDDNPLVGDAGSVTYYYDLPEREVTLTLTGDWKFTMEGPYLNKTGDYSLEGDKITLDFVRIFDGTATGTVGDEKIVLVMNDATLTFREKIDFTVSFNSNGGSSVDSIKVTNGKTVSAPDTAPTKEGCNFLGWYTDEALTNEFKFNSAIITKDITLYAKWSTN